jgi:hypothetical protein
MSDKVSDAILKVAEIVSVIDSPGPPGLMISFAEFLLYIQTLNKIASLLKSWATIATQASFNSLKSHRIGRLLHAN